MSSWGPESCVRSRSMTWCCERLSPSQAESVDPSICIPFAVPQALDDPGPPTCPPFQLLHVNADQTVPPQLQSVAGLASLKHPAVAYGSARCRSETLQH